MSSIAVDVEYSIGLEEVEVCLKLIKNWLLTQEGFRGGQLENVVICRRLSTARRRTERELARRVLLGSLQEPTEPRNVAFPDEDGGNAPRIGHREHGQRFVDT